MTRRPCQSSQTTPHPQRRERQVGPNSLATAGRGRKRERDLAQPSGGALKVQVYRNYSEPICPRLCVHLRQRRWTAGQRRETTKRERESGTCLLRPSMLQTMSLEYGCSNTYLNRPVCGSNRSYTKHIQFS